MDNLTKAKTLWNEIENNLDDRGCFNGIDEDVMSELRSDLINIIRDKLSE